MSIFGCRSLRPTFLSRSSSRGWSGHEHLVVLFTRELAQSSPRSTNNDSCSPASPKIADHFSRAARMAAALEETRCCISSKRKRRPSHPERSVPRTDTLDGCPQPGVNRKGPIPLAAEPGRERPPRHEWQTGGITRSRFRTSIEIHADAVYSSATDAAHRSACRNVHKWPKT